MEARDGAMLLGLFAGQRTAMDEEVEAVHGRETEDEARRRPGERTQLQGLWHHLEGDGGEEHAAREAERERHDEARRLPPQGQSAADR